MLIYLIAIVEALAYLSAVPVCAAFRLSTRDGLRFGVGLAAFERRFALRRADRASEKGLPKIKKRPGKGNAKLLWPTVRRLRGADIRLRGSLGLDDAAATALACGALTALVTTLGAHAGRVRTDIAPRFDADAPCAEFQGMIRIRSGKLITAMAASQMENWNRRIARWTDIRSKRS